MITPKEFRNTINETAVFAHYEGLPDRQIKGNFLALHEVATDALVAWEYDRALLDVASRLVDGLNAQISEYLNILENTDDE